MSPQVCIKFYSYTQEQHNDTSQGFGPQTLLVNKYLTYILEGVNYNVLQCPYISIWIFFFFSGKIQELVLGIPHRGRLNLLTGLLKYPTAQLFHKVWTVGCLVNTGKLFILIIIIMIIYLTYTYV